MGHVLTDESKNSYWSGNLHQNIFCLSLSPSPSPLCCWHRLAESWNERLQI